MSQQILSDKNLEDTFNFPVAYNKLIQFASRLLELISKIQCITRVWRMFIYRLTPALWPQLELSLQWCKLSSTGLQRQSWGAANSWPIRGLCSSIAALLHHRAGGKSKDGPGQIFQVMLHLPVRCTEADTCFTLGIFRYSSRVLILTFSSWSK